MIFMKILHFTIFYASKAVANYLYSKDIDPNTVHLNDYKFIEKIFAITVMHLGVKPRISIQQFFKYGFAEQKMMMCVDTIKAVKNLNKAVKRELSLSSTRKITHRRQSSFSSERFAESSVKLVTRSKNLAEL